MWPRGYRKPDPARQKRCCNFELWTLRGNPAHARLANLVVRNDDEIAPHSGFPLHRHRDMEIVTYVREGVLKHEDRLAGVTMDRLTCYIPLNDTEQKTGVAVPVSSRREFLRAAGASSGAAILSTAFVQATARASTNYVAECSPRRRKP